MKLSLKISFIVLILLSISKEASAQSESTAVSEGPYIFFKGDQIAVKWVEDGQMKETDNPSADFLQSEFQLGLNPKVFLQNKKIVPEFYQEYEGVSNLVVISDVHGQYGLTVELLKAHGVIDEDNNWNYGKGHLVVNGDILGRGDSVTEVLWLVYKLEQQAKIKGGHVHFLLGNHELMVIENDLRFLNEKYVSAARIMGIRPASLYAEDAVLGNWLRKRPIIITIDDLLITHAGISPAFIGRNLTAKKVNTLFYKKILKASNRRKNELQNFLTGEEGPIWYRGYFIQPTPTEQQLDDMLDFFDSKKIIVGHTSLGFITGLFGGRVIGVDSNIKDGNTGEILIVENGEAFRGRTNGSRLKL
ncbi:metallophosphoesterase [Aquiflexum sp. TKW24L]|uniref:metallophosphoesterase n=1 Tax=Aquiflexum sp. TKW24L TaxID=2942212 RepID=UPI0020BFAB74|nr:metallophosphoesterase [Aquiflexum sp. TKW24L]MCL6259209.1 metallophosphoesterase [Aquiflexum sp. TKW24L]